MDNIEKLQQQNQLLSDQIAILMRCVDQNKLAKLTNTKDLPPKVRVTLYEENVVCSWEILKDVVDYTGKVDVEEQIARVNYLVSEKTEKGVTKQIMKSVEMKLPNFYKNLQWVEVEVEGTTVDTKTGKIWYSFTYRDEPYRIEQVYINK